MAARKVAMLTAGGLAPCLSSAVGALIERYADLAPDTELIGYLYGYRGLLLGESLAVTPEARARAHLLHRHGGTPFGNSRVKLTNVKDLVKRGLVRKGQDALKVAADRLAKDGVAILHVIGGDDTNTTAADLSAYLAAHGYDLTVVGLPKTVDNDIVPIRQSLGAWTAAEQGAIFFENIVNEQTTSRRMLLVHEVMGRHCGWLTAATARTYRERLSNSAFPPALLLDRRRLDIDAVYPPEMPLDVEREAERLSSVMDDKDCVALFVSEGAGLGPMAAEMEARGEAIDRDPFGHVRLDKINVGAWFAGRFAKLLGAERTLVQKSGYFARSAAPNAADLRLIQSMVDLAVDCGLRGRSGVIGHDEERGGELRAIEFSRIRGGKPFDVTADWFAGLLREIGQSTTE
jgi:pyrophosphate--fructose-6-phosphate 1-phosphotransferase